MRRADRYPSAQLSCDVGCRQCTSSISGILTSLAGTSSSTNGWESIFVGYRSNSGIRTIGRRWRDLLQGSLGCPEDLADALVRDQVIIRQDRDLMAIRDPEELLAAMAQVLDDMGADLADSMAVRPADRSRLVAAYARLRDSLFEPDEDTEDEPDEDTED